MQFVSKYCHKNCSKYWKKQFSTKSLEAFTLVSSTRFVNMTICATFSCHTITQKSLTVFCFGPVYEIMIKLFFIPKVYDCFHWYGKIWHEIFVLEIYYLGLQCNHFPAQYPKQLNEEIDIFVLQICITKLYRI